MRAIVWAFGLTVIAVQFSGAEVIGTATVISDEAAIGSGSHLESLIFQQPRDLKCKFSRCHPRPDRPDLARRARCKFFPRA